MPSMACNSYHYTYMCDLIEAPNMARFPVSTGALRHMSGSLPLLEMCRIAFKVIEAIEVQV
jgi:hypothetical protein